MNDALSSRDATFALHLSLLSMMGDSDGYGEIILDKYFADSTRKKDLKKEWDNDFYPDNLPFVFSTVAIDDKAGGSLGSLLMWKKYGNAGNGALIRFDWKKLQAFCRVNGYRFSPCRYRDIEDIDVLIRLFYHDDLSFARILEEVCLAKSISCVYEQEWRVICYSGRDNIHTKPTSRGIMSYVEIRLPIELIEEICLGPLTDEKTTLESVLLLKNKLRDKCGGRVNFEVTKSKIDMKPIY